MSDIKKLKFFANGQWHESKTTKFMDIFDPSTGAVIAKTPCCTKEEVGMAIKSAKDAFRSWADMPVMKRTKILYNMRDLIDKNYDELISLCSKEHGKVLAESAGDVLKTKEIIELACGTPTFMMGETIMNTSTGYDTVTYKEPVGVFAGIAPFNFPAMVPMGWMVPLCIATGNTIVIKASSFTPMSSMRFAELWKEAGLPDGVLNVVTCSRTEAELFLTHPDVKGVTFVGSTSVGLHIYSTAAAHGKRVQALCEAKNHGLVMDDAALERTARGIINSSFGCAGERCMALPVIVAHEAIADELVALLVKYAKELKIGPAYDKTTKLGPVVNETHKKFVLENIEKGIKEGAKLILDGRGVIVKGYENGCYIGPTIFDHVEPGMTVGDQEIFGPVLCIKRVKNFEEGLQIMNNNEFANGSVIFTQSGYYAREFARRTDGGMVGINVGIPVPVSLFSFTGHKHSFFGDLHTLGKDGVKFFTETKTVTSTWFSEEEKKKTTVDSWDGSIGG